MLFPVARWLLMAGFLLCLSGCTRSAKSGSEQNASLTRNEHADVEASWFEDITDAAGVRFKHDSGSAGKYFMPESTGSGGALLDFDNDGRLDIYLVQNGGSSS